MVVKPVIQSPLVQMFFHTDRATVHTIKKKNHFKRPSPDCWVLVRLMDRIVQTQ